MVIDCCSFGHKVYQYHTNAIPEHNHHHFFCRLLRFELLWAWWGGMGPLHWCSLTLVQSGEPKSHLWSLFARKKFCHYGNTPKIQSKHLGGIVYEPRWPALGPTLHTLLNTPEYQWSLQHFLHLLLMTQQAH